MTPIYKMWNGSYIDLSKIVHVSELEYIPEQFGYPIFHIHFQLMEKPVIFSFSPVDRIDLRPMRVDAKHSVFGDTVKEHNLSISKANEAGYRATHEKFISDWTKYHEQNS